MMRMTPMFVLAIVVGATAVQGGDWPRFLGPNGTGVVEEGEKVARSWPEGGPKELWKISVGYGFGGAAIAGGKVFLLDRPNKTEDLFRVLDLKTGRTLWQYAYPAAGFRGGFPGSRSTPTIDGNLAFTVGILGHIHCFDINSNKVAWRKSLKDDFGAKAGDWGFAQSPLVVGDLVILSAAGGPNGIVALDKKTGVTRWKTPSFGETDTYTSPMLVSIDGVEQIVMWHRGELAAFDTRGKMLWRHRWRTNRPIPQPVALGDGRFFLTIGYGSGCAIIRASRSGGSWSVTELLQEDFSASKVPPALLYHGHIYTNSDETRRGLQCLDTEGNIKWETGRRPDFGLGSMIIADGVIFIVNGDSGELVMAEASPGSYKELGRAQVLGGPDVWAPLALSNGQLVLRDHKQVKCVYVGAGEAPEAQRRDSAGGD